MSRSRTLVALLAAVALACGDSKTAPTLDGAKGRIAVFVPSKFEERSTALTSDDINNPTKFSTYTWHMSTAQGFDAVEAFYKAQWPGAGRVDEQDGVTYRLPPLPDGEEPLGESVSVTIRKSPKNGRILFDISEDVFSEKRK